MPMYVTYGYGFYGYPMWEWALMLVSLVIAVAAQIGVSSAFNRYQKVMCASGLTGAMAARRILDANGLAHVPVERVGGRLTDHYDPRTNVIRLSPEVYDSTSVAAIGVAAHESGHAIQYQKGYAPIKIRAAILPVTRLGSMLAFPLVVLGVLFSAVDFLVPVGVVLFAAVVLFQLVTLPVELNASSRAMAILRDGQMLNPQELEGARRVLTAAAMTYVAALLTALIQLLRLLAIASRRRN